MTKNKTVVLPSPHAPEDEYLTFLHYFSGPAEFGLGEAILEAAALRGIKVRIIKRDIRLGGIDLLADEPFTTDLLAASDGQFDGFHSGFPCSSFSRARFRPGGPPPVRDRQHLRGRPSNSRAQQLEAERGTLLATRSAVMVRAIQFGAKKRGLRCTATLENPADPGVDPYPSAWLLPALADIVTEPDVKCAIHNICCFGPPHWMVDRFSSKSRDIREKVLLQSPTCAIVDHNSHSIRSFVPATALRGIRHVMAERHDKPQRAFNHTPHEHIYGSRWVEYASIKRVSVSASHVQETRQRSGKRVSRWWFTSADPILVHGTWLGGDWTQALGLHRRSALQRHRCVHAHQFVWSSRFPGSTVGVGRESPKRNLKGVRPGTSRNDLLSVQISCVV